jgi:hypothetical protein
MPEIVDGTKLREYQEPQLFKQKFQRSETCRLFRKAWHIPPDGFEKYSSYGIFHDELRKMDAAYATSETFTKNRATLIAKRKLWAEYKISDGDLELATYEFARRIPSVKYDEDLDSIVRKSKKPPYWRSFIEECLLFHEAETEFVNRPPLELKAKWNNDLKRYEILIGNIFYDTTAEEFAERRFTKTLHDLQKRYLAYGPVPRQKKNFPLDMGILKHETSGLTDRMIADEVEGDTDTKSSTFMRSPREDQKRKNKVKTARKRLKKRLKPY